MSIDELRNRCRTCRYLALPNGGIYPSGYCWQCDKVVKLRAYGLDEPIRYLDPGCADVHGEEPVWEPLKILEPYFRNAVG